jgi:hypothetical protein
MSLLQRLHHRIRQQAGSYRVLRMTHILRRTQTTVGARLPAKDFAANE